MKRGVFEKSEQPSSNGDIAAGPEVGGENIFMGFFFISFGIFQVFSSAFFCAEGGAERGVREVGREKGAERCGRGVLEVEI